MTMINRRCLLLASLCLLLPAGSQAQDIAPPPKKAPRTPVTQQTLPNDKTVTPPKILAGQITVLETEQLRLNGFDLRLFGIVPPQLSASFGPQARAVLDNLTANQETRCTIRDRDRAGRYLATCHGRNDTDLAVELLKRGLAIAARGSLQPTELAPAYFAAEQAAQAQKLGLWTVMAPPAAKPDLQPAAVSAAPPAAPLVAGESSATAKPVAASQATPAPAPVPVAPVATAVAAPAPQPEKPAIIPAAATIAPEAKAAIVSSLTAASDQAEAEQALPDEKADYDILARYQLLLSALLMLATALGITFALWYHRWSERRTDIRATAAALRGELQAARTLIVSRLRAMTDTDDDKTTAWPRVRTLVFQAYVGRLGLLGAELARQIASIYGLASDYTAYYSTPAEQLKQAPVGKKAAMETLQNHIEEVLPKLEQIEASGQRPPMPHFMGTAPLPRPTPPAKPMPFAALRDMARRLAGSSANSYADAKALPRQPRSIASPPSTEAEESVLKAEATGTSAPAEPAATRIKPLWEILRGLRNNEPPVSPATTTHRDPTASDTVPDYTTMSQEEIDIMALNNLTEDDYKSYDDLVAQPSRRAKRA
jgi:endonuclease YncB( thermonuclease family)